MTFPIYPNNYNSLVPPPSQPEESNAFSEGIRRLRRLKGAQLECATLLLLWLDVTLVTHQIVMDYALSSQNGSNNSNVTDSLAQTGPLVFRSEDNPALTNPASMAIFIAITAMSFVFFVEGIVRNLHSRIIKRRFHTMNVFDTCVCGVSFVLNLSLLVAQVAPLIRDIVALLIALRLVRMACLFRGLTLQEKRQILRMLDGYKRDESFSAEHQRMLQTELENRTKECQDLRELVKSATLSRNRLKLKQQLQEQQGQQEPTEGNLVQLAVSADDATLTGPCKQPAGSGAQADSGNSSDASPDTPPLEAFGSGGIGTPTDIELTGVAFPVDNPDCNDCVTSKM